MVVRETNPWSASDVASFVCSVRMDTRTMLRGALLFLFLSVSPSVTVDFRRPVPPKHDLHQQFYFPKYRPEVFYDNNVVPEDAEVSVFVFKDQIRRVFFLVEKERNSLLLTASPCSAPTEWHIFRKPLPPPEKSEESNGETWDQSLDLYRDDGSSTEPVVGGSFYGSGRLSFERRDAPTGIYMLEFDSDSSDTSVRVYGTSDSDTNSPFPLLPPKPKVDVLQVKLRRRLNSLSLKRSLFL